MSETVLLIRSSGTARTSAAEGIHDADRATDTPRRLLAATEAVVPTLRVPVVVLTKASSLIGEVNMKENVSNMD